MYMYIYIYMTKIVVYISVCKFKKSWETRHLSNDSWKLKKCLCTDFLYVCTNFIIKNNITPQKYIQSTGIDSLHIKYLKSQLSLTISGAYYQKEKNKEIWVLLFKIGKECNVHEFLFSKLVVCLVFSLASNVLRPRKTKGTWHATRT